MNLKDNRYVLCIDRNSRTEKVPEFQDFLLPKGKRYYTVRREANEPFSGRLLVHLKIVKTGNGTYRASFVLNRLTANVNGDCNKDEYVYMYATITIYSDKVPILDNISRYSNMSLGSLDEYHEVLKDVMTILHDIYSKQLQLELNEKAKKGAGPN